MAIYPDNSRLIPYPVEYAPTPPIMWRGVRGPVRGMMGMVGMGATGAEIGTSITGTAATIAGSNATAIAGALGVAVPIIGTAIAGIAMAVTLWLNRMGPKQKVWTTQIADEATAQLKEVKRVYFSEPYNPANQQAALGAVDSLLQAIRDGCGQTQMGEPGQRCIAERLVRGGTAPWCPTGTGCDYYTEYRDPIANDPRAVAYAAAVDGGLVNDPTSAAEMLGGGATAIVNSGFLPLVLIGAAALFVAQGLGVGD